MTAETLIKENTRFNRDGSPLEVVIPYETFIEFIEEYGLDLSPEEVEAIREAKKDHDSGNRQNYISAEALEKELGLM